MGKTYAFVETRTLKDIICAFTVSNASNFHELPAECPQEVYWQKSSVGKARLDLPCRADWSFGCQFRVQKEAYRQRIARLHQTVVHRPGQQDGVPLSCCRCVQSAGPAGVLRSERIQVHVLFRTAGMRIPQY